MKKIRFYKDGEVVAFVNVLPSQIDRVDIWLKRVCMCASRMGMSYQYDIVNNDEE